MMTSHVGITNKNPHPAAMNCASTQSHTSEVFSDLSGVFTPFAVMNNDLSVYATYPPANNSLHSNKTGQLHTPILSKTSHLPQSIVASGVEQQGGKENLSPNPLSKRHSEGINFRQTLKRCRGNQTQLLFSPLSFENEPHLEVSMNDIDSTGHLKLLVKEQSLSVLFVMETKLGPNSISHFRSSLCFHNGLEVPRVGLSGGLMLLWKDDVDVTLLNYNMNIFDCYLACGNGPTWHFTAFYGAPAAHNRLHTWTLLERLKDVAPLLPWLVIGDFNKILSNQYKSGGALRNEAQMDKFRHVFDRCHLNEQAFKGDQFTWIKGRHSVDTIKERLDWCFANTLWGDTFQPITTQHLNYYRSDHRAIAVQILPINSTHQQQEQKKRTRFRFEKIWLQEEEATNLIQQNWHQVTTENVAAVFVNNLQRCANSLQQWHQQKFGSFKKNM
ncbi:hypothetical protein CsatA_015475 [Cannabis sativa]